MGVKVANNAVTTTVGAVSSIDTSVTVTSGTGALFPILGTGDYFYATLAAPSGIREIVKVTARTDDVMTIVRGQEGTTAQAFPATCRFELRITAASITDMIAEHDQASEITFTPTGGIAATNVQSAIAELDSEAAKLADLASTAAGKGAALVGTTSGETVQYALDNTPPNRPIPRFNSVLRGYQQGLSAPTVRIEGDSLPAGSGATSGAEQWHFKAFVSGQTFEWLPGRTGQYCNLCDLYDVPGIAVARNALPGSVCAGVLGRLSNYYQPDASFSQFDQLVSPAPAISQDLVFVGFGNNEGAANMGAAKFSWFLEETIRQLVSRGKEVIYMVPHDRATGTVGSRTLDRAVLATMQDVGLRIANYYGVGVMNMRDRFRQLVDDGVQTVDQLFPFVGDPYGSPALDNVHCNNLGQEYYVAELLSLLTPAGSVEFVTQTAPLAPVMPNRLFRQANYFMNVNRWKMIFAREAGSVGTLTTATQPDNSRTPPMFGLPDQYLMLSASGDKAIYRMVGNGFGILFSKQPVAGSAGIYVNGVLTDTVSFNAESEKEYMYWSSSNVASSQGQKRNAAIEVRWISGSIGAVGLMASDARNPGQYTYDTGFATLTGTWADSGTFKRTTTQNDYVEFEVIGTGMALDLPRGADYGIVTVKVNGTDTHTIDLYSVGTVTTVNTLVARGLAWGKHTIRLTVATKNASSSGYKFDWRLFSPLDEDLDRTSYATRAISGQSLRVPEDRGGTVTTSDISAAGLIAITTKLLYSTPLIGRLSAD